MKNIALLGFGKIGKKFYEKSKKNKKIFISHILKKKLIKLKDKKVKILNKIEPVINNKKIKGYIIATPVNSHFQYAKKIIKIKKPFIIEKPIVANLKELEVLFNLCKSFKKSIFVNYQDLYNPAFVQLKKQIKKIGSYSKINIFFGKFQKIKKNKNNLSFSPAFDWLPHPLAIAIKLQGIPNKVRIIKNKIYILKKNIIQSLVICLYYRNKVIQINFSNQYRSPKRRIKVKGSKATLVYDGYKKNMLIKKIKNKSFKKVKYIYIDPFESLINKFSLSLEKDLSKNDIFLSYNVMKILFKIEEEMKSKMDL